MMVRVCSSEHVTRCLQWFEGPSGLHHETQATHRTPCGTHSHIQRHRSSQAQAYAQAHAPARCHIKQSTLDCAPHTSSQTVRQSFLHPIQRRLGTLSKLNNVQNSLHSGDADDRMSFRSIDSKGERCYRRRKSKLIVRLQVPRL